MILITGGAGYIGSHTNKLLNKLGYETVVFDNLERGHKQFVKWGKFFKGDLRNISDLEKVFKEYTIESVIHFAAYAYVGESMKCPDKYYENNIYGTLNLLKTMKKFGVKRIVFSSSCATYGVPETQPIDEEAIQNPINPYGRSKLFAEKMIKDFSYAFDMKYIILRYFNVAGADINCEIGELHDPETHLIPLAIFSAFDKSKKLKIFGNDYPTKDGTCIRDYIHVSDLADAHVKSLEFLREENKSDIFNVGIGNGYSVKEVVDTISKIVGRDVNFEYSSRREGDPPVLVASNKKITMKLGWQPKIDNLIDIVKTAYNWYKKIGAIK